MEEEEFGVAGGYEAGDVVVEEFVDAFEVPGTQFVCPVLVLSRSTSSGSERLEVGWGEGREGISHLTRCPLHLFDDI